MVIPQLRLHLQHPGWRLSIFPPCARAVVLTYAGQQTAACHLWPRLDQRTLVKFAPTSLPRAFIVSGLSYGVTPKLRAPLRKPGRGLCIFTPYARARFSLTMRDSRPSAAMWPRLDQRTLVKIAPTSLPLRLHSSGYELRGHPATESPSAETRQG